MFEFDGYPCRYMLSYLKKKQVMLLPDKYILRRWTKNAKIGAVYDDAACSSFDEGSSQSLMARPRMLAHKASLLVDDASLTDARSNFLLGEFDKMRIKLKDIDDGGTVGMSKNRISSREETQVDVIQMPSEQKAAANN
ncbi:Protein FAR1-RELATED SEQUENCE 5 [Abeliophyllum distichum]|uniref:Protein FAR1-RELATED SEQUENCE n=1 Tax=Abeliophyllum distichum TaxID=126358 RepID=A0ABD1V3Y7_9LAMI